MDPNATLADIRNILDDVALHINDGYDVDENLAELAELVNALDEWLIKGGVLPNAWKK